MPSHRTKRLGLFTLGLRHEILSSRKYNLIFLGVVFAAPLARLWSWLQDGQPSWLWVALMSTELSTALVLLLSPRGVRRGVSTDKA